MGSFEEDKDIIKQNLECVTERPDAVFGIRMLMEDKCEMPDRETVQDVMDRHLGRSECFCYDAQVIGFSASQYSVHFAKENKDISPQLLIMGCKPRKVRPGIAPNVMTFCSNVPGRLQRQI